MVKIFKFVLVVLASMLIGCSLRVGEQPHVRSLVEKVEYQLAKAKQLRGYNAFIHLSERQSLVAANRLAQVSNPENLPLFGMTLAIKDNIEVANMPHTVGHKLLTEYHPKSDATVIELVKDAGAIVLGKANMHELAYGITSNNAAFGAVANAHDYSKFAGGSSGGVAVAVALGITDAGLGTDTGGSTRIPASLNGIVGFRATTGRYSNRGLSLISTTRDTVGPMAKDVTTIARLDAVLANETYSTQTIEAANLRLGVPKAYFYENLSSDVAKEMKRVLTKLTQAGVTLVFKDIDLVPELNERVSFPVVLFETKQLLPKLIERAGLDLSLDEFVEGISSPDVKEIIKAALEQPVPESVYQEAITVLRPQLQQAYQKYFDNNQLDGLIIPATPLVAQDIEGSDREVTLNGKSVPTFATFIKNTDPSSNAGIPSLVLPIKNKNGLPIGLQIDAPVNSDRKLLAVGLLIERLID